MLFAHAHWKCGSSWLNGTYQKQFWFLVHFLIITAIRTEVFALIVIEGCWVGKKYCTHRNAIGYRCAQRTKYTHSVQCTLYRNENLMFLFFHSIVFVMSFGKARTGLIMNAWNMVCSLLCIEMCRSYRFSYKLELLLLLLWLAILKIMTRANDDIDNGNNEHCGVYSNDE